MAAENLYSVINKNILSNLPVFDVFGVTRSNLNGDITANLGILAQASYNPQN